MNEILLTGATGLIGGEIAIRLLRRSCDRVWCLTRGASPQQAEQRLRRRLLLPRYEDPQVTADEIDLGRRVICLYGDFNRPSLGLPAEIYNHVQDSVTAIIHCAAELSFDENSDCYAANCAGLWNVLEFAASCPDAVYAHFSTAACCGKRPNEVVAEERPPLARNDHFNQYTHSKAIGEALVRAYGDRLQALILRPPLTLPDTSADRRQIRSIMWALSVISRLDFIPVGLDARTDLAGVSFVAEATLALLRKYPRLKSNCFHLTSGQDWAVRPHDLVRIAREELGKKEDFKLAASTNDAFEQLLKRSESEQQQLVQAATTFLPFFNANTVYDNRRLRAEAPEVFERCDPPELFLPRLMKLYHFGHAEHEVAMLTR